MSSRKLRFAIFGNVYQPRKSDSIQQILSFLSRQNAEIMVEREFYELAAAHLMYSLAYMRLDLPNRLTSPCGASAPSSM